MSTLGKILIVFQVLLSICFMAFAGAVSFTHTTWRTEAENARKELTAVTADRDAIKGEFKTFQDTTTVDRAKDKNDKVKAEADKLAAMQELVQLATEKKNLTNEKTAAEQQAIVAGDEAKARLEESRQLRQINEKLLVSRDENFKQKLALEDKVRSKDVDLTNAQGKIKQMLNEIVALRKQVQQTTVGSSALDIDPSVDAPPKVEGKVMEVLASKAEGNTDLVAVSIGSNDGLVKGHTLMVYRLGDKKDPKRSQSMYLGKIRVLETKPNYAVGEVIKGTRTAVIKEGDQVTTQL